MSKGTAISEKAVADALIKHLKHVKTVGSQWYVYKNGVWRDSRKDAYRPLVYELTDPEQWKVRLENAALAQVEGRQQCDDSIFRGAIAMHEGGVAINVRNGILLVDATSIRILAHNHEFYFTRSLQVEYDPQATCPRYRSVFAQVLPHDDDQRLKRILLGYVLWPDSRYEVVNIDIGEAGTGKSTLADPIMHILGSNDGGLLTSLSLGQICDPNCYALAKLRYALVNLGTELQSLAIDESENFKKIISGEPFEARPIYSPPFTMTTFPKLWFLANNIPRFKKGTDAEIRRARFCIFSVKPEKPDTGLKSYLRENELPGIFNLMLEGLQELIRTGSIPLGGPASREVHDRFRVSNDTIKAFIEECCIKGPSESCPKEHLGNAYTAFCEEYSLPFKGDAHFFQKLYDRFPEIKDSKKRDEGKRVPSVVGLSLKMQLSQVVII